MSAKLLSIICTLVILTFVGLIKLYDTNEAMDECQKKQSFEVCFYLIHR